MWSLLLFILINFAYADFKPLDPELKNYDYPFPVKFHPVSIKDNAYKMAYMDVSPKGKVKGVIVLLHGKNFSGAYWERTAKDLLQEGYRVIMPDQIGFGKSSKPEAFPYTFQLLGELTQKLIKSREVKKYQLIGHSMGGMLATRMALMYPEAVEKLLLVNPIGLEDWKIHVPYKTLMNSMLQN